MIRLERSRMRSPGLEGQGEVVKPLNLIVVTDGGMSSFVYLSPPHPLLLRPFTLSLVTMNWNPAKFTQSSLIPSLLEYALRPSTPLSTGLNYSVLPHLMIPRVYS